MKKKVLSLIVFISLFSSLNSFLCAETKSTTPEPYKENEFPSWLKDLRRAEIITLGAMPFITFNASLAYSFGNYAAHDFNSDYFVNPFSSDSNASSYSEDEQKGILLTSLGISFGIGLSDFVFHSIKRESARQKAKKLQNKNIEIESVKDDPDAVRLPPPENGFPEQGKGAEPDEKSVQEIEISSDTSLEVNEIPSDQEINTSKKSSKKAKKIKTETEN